MINSSSIVRSFLNSEGLIFLAVEALVSVAVATTLDFSRTALVLFWIISSALVIIKHGVLRFILHFYRKKGYNLKHVAVVGNGKTAKRYYKDVKDHPEFGYKIAGYFSAKEREELGVCLGRYEDIGAYLEKKARTEKQPRKRLEYFEELKKLKAERDA